jgi:hypothetical protein
MAAGELEGNVDELIAPDGEATDGSDDEGELERISMELGGIVVELLDDVEVDATVVKGTAVMELSSVEVLELDGTLDSKEELDAGADMDTAGLDVARPDNDWPDEVVDAKEGTVELDSDVKGV